MSFALTSWWLDRSCRPDCWLLLQGLKPHVSGSSHTSIVLHQQRLTEPPPSSSSLSFTSYKLLLSHFCLSVLLSLLSRYPSPNCSIQCGWQITDGRLMHRKHTHTFAQVYPQTQMPSSCCKKKKKNPKHKCESSKSSDGLTKVLLELIMPHLFISSEQSTLWQRPCNVTNM